MQILEKQGLLDKEDKRLWMDGKLPFASNLCIHKQKRRKLDEQTECADILVKRIWVPTLPSRIISSYELDSYPEDLHPPHII